MADAVVIAAPDNPVIKPGEMDAETLELQRMAEAADAQAMGAPPNESAPPNEPAKSQNPPAEIPPNEPAKEGPARDEQGRFTKADGTKSQPNEPAPVAPTGAEQVKPESAYTKAQKEEARKEKTWREINARREETDRKEAELARREQEFTQRQTRPPEPQPDRYSSQALFKAAQDFANDAAKFEQNEQWADAAESHRLAAQAQIAGRTALEEEHKTQSTRQQTEFSNLFNANANEFAKEFPDVLKIGTDLNTKVAAIFQEEPMLNFHPQGVRKAYELMQLREKGTRVDALQAKVAGLEKEIQRLGGKLQLDGHPPAPQTTQKGFDHLSVKEQTEELGRMAEEADRNQQPL